MFLATSTLARVFPMKCSCRFRPWNTFRFTRLAAVLLVSALALTSQVRAVPVTYTEVIPSTFGTLGSLSFSRATLTLTFQGNTDNVTAFSKGGVSGDVNLQGTAMLKLTDSTGALLAQATFLPSAGIFVGVDNNNSGIGFGSFGVLPTDPSFPGQPAYPASLAASVSLATYDLKSNISLSGGAISQVGFPGPFSPPLPLPTTAGNFTVTVIFLEASTFSAQLQSVTAFSAFAAAAQIDVQEGRFEIRGRFTLGAASNGINPANEVVTVQLGSLSLTVPQGSFTRGSEGQYTFEGKINGVSLDMRIVPGESGGRYFFTANGRGANLAGMTVPITVVLTIGDDSGTTTASAMNDD
jgi:hypothetical protein